jgi:radical SAM protein with 4Fe4S-binding SPASM domain
VHDLRRSLEAALELGARSITLLRPKGDWAHTHWPGFPSADDFQATAAGVRAFLASRPAVRMYVDTAMRAEWADLGLFEDPEPEVAGCGGGQRHVAVTPEGDVFPCSHARSDHLCMGNLLTDEFDLLWSLGPGRRARRQYLGACRGVCCACRAERPASGPSQALPLSSPDATGARTPYHRFPKHRDGSRRDGLAEELIPLKPSVG